MEGRIRDGFFKIYLFVFFASDDLMSSAHFEAKLAYEKGIVIFSTGLDNRGTCGLMFEVWCWRSGDLFEVGLD